MENTTAITVITNDIVRKIVEEEVRKPLEKEIRRASERLDQWNGTYERMSKSHEALIKRELIRELQIYEINRFLKENNRSKEELNINSDRYKRDEKVDWHKFNKDFYDLKNSLYHIYKTRMPNDD